MKHRKKCRCEECLKQYETRKLVVGTCLTCGCDSIGSAAFFRQFERLGQPGIDCIVCGRVMGYEQQEDADGNITWTERELF